MPIKVDTLNIETVIELIEKSPQFKLRYCEGERGWGANIGDGLAIVLNIPARTTRIGLLDVVRVIDVDDEKAAGKVVWQAYDAISWVNYPSETDDQAEAWYKLLCQAADRSGFRVEGMVAGIAAVVHGNAVALRDVLHNEGLDLRDVTINTVLRSEEIPIAIGHDALRDKVYKPIYTQGIGPSNEYNGSYDVIHHGDKTLDEVLAMVRAIPVPDADKMDSPDPRHPGRTLQCPPAIGFDEPAPAVCGNACRIPSGKYVLLRGGHGADPTGSHEVELEQVEAWVRERFE